MSNPSLWTTDKKEEENEVQPGPSVSKKKEKEKEKEKEEVNPQPETLPLRQEIGLPNIRANCYVNTSLQFLFSAQTFCEDLAKLRNNFDGIPATRLISYFVDLWKARDKKIQDSGNKVSLLVEFINTVAETCPTYRNVRGNSPIRFLCDCLKEMEATVRRLHCGYGTVSRCPVRANFLIEMRNITTCSSCGMQGNRLEEYYYLLLHVVHRSVEEYLHEVVNNPKKVEHKCMMCGGKSAISVKTFHTLPKFLILKLEWVALDTSNPYDKSEVYINRELQINIPEQEQGESTATFQLISIINHIGHRKTGHVVADCLKRDSHKWMNFDDKWVTETTVEDALKKGSTSAYALLYERERALGEVIPLL